MSETMTELKPAAWFFRWPGSTSWRNSDVDPTGRIPNEQFATVLCAYDHEDIAAALSAAEARGREAAAKWHDDAAADARERSRQAREDGATSITRLTFDLTAQSHDSYAAAIRKGLTP